jgi:hypothetical protein
MGYFWGRGEVRLERYKHVVLEVGERPINSHAMEHFRGQIGTSLAPLLAVGPMAEPGWPALCQEVFYGPVSKDVCPSPGRDELTAALEALD